MNSKKKLILNTVSSITLQIVTLACGFVIPRLMIQQYGSEVNGLVNSITQFLSIISFSELGIGAVIRSALYKPLSNKDNKITSSIIASGERFFKHIAYILILYVVVLIFVYPLIVNQNFGWLYTALLIIAISISYFAQYYFGIIDSLLLTADQHGYIHYISLIVTLILNTCACCILINSGASIQAVKLTTSILYLVRPLAIRVYVQKHYSLDRKIKYHGEPIAQKWNGIAQHVAAVIIDNTDVVVLTALSTLSNVSIYSVYNMVAYGVKMLLNSATGGVQSLLGEMIVKKQTEKIKSFFGVMEFIIHIAVTYLFTCTGILIVPFVCVYTVGIYDVNYIQPLFAVLLVSAHACHCLRLPYNIAILAAGHYRQTQSNYIIAAIMNVVISVVTVNLWGLVGVALGTLAAMLFQTIWMAIYDSKYIIQCSIKNFIKQCMVDILTAGLIVLSTMWIKMEKCSYAAWFMMAVKVSVIALVIVILTNVIFYRAQLIHVVKYFSKKRNKP